MASELELNDTRVEFIADYVIKTLKIKPDKWSKMYSVEETKQMFLDFFEKQDIPCLIVTATAAGGLNTQFEWPNNPKAKACYFVKKGREAIQKETNFRNAFLYGDMSYQPLDQLSAFVDEVNFFANDWLCVLGRPVFNQPSYLIKRVLTRYWKKSSNGTKMSIVLQIPSLLFIKNNVTTKLQHEIIIKIQFVPPIIIAGDFADMQLPYKQT